MLDLNRPFFPGIYSTTLKAMEATASHSQHNESLFLSLKPPMIDLIKWKINNYPQVWPHCVNQCLICLKSPYFRVSLTTAVVSASWSTCEIYNLPYRSLFRSGESARGTVFTSLERSIKSNLYPHGNLGALESSVINNYSLWDLKWSKHIEHPDVLY